MGLFYPSMFYTCIRVCVSVFFFIIIIYVRIGISRFFFLENSSAGLYQVFISHYDSADRRTVCASHPIRRASVRLYNNNCVDM